MMKPSDRRISRNASNKTFGQAARGGGALGARRPRARCALICAVILAGGCDLSTSKDLFTDVTAYARFVPNPTVTPPAYKRFYLSGDALTYTVSDTLAGAAIHCTVNNTEFLAPVITNGAFALNYSATPGDVLNAQSRSVVFWATKAEYNDSATVTAWHRIALPGDIVPVSRSGFPAYTALTATSLAPNVQLAAPRLGAYLGGWYYFAEATALTPDDTTPYEIRAIHTETAALDSASSTMNMVTVLAADAYPVLSDLITPSTLPFRRPGALLVRAEGTGAALYLSDSLNNRVLRLAIADPANPAVDLTAAPEAFTVLVGDPLDAGTAGSDITVDGAIYLDAPAGLAWAPPPTDYPGLGAAALGLDVSGAPAEMLYLADSGNHRLIAVDFTAAATPGTTAAHAVTVADATVLADLTAPSALALDPDAAAATPAPVLYLLDGPSGTARVLKIDVSSSVTTDEFGVSAPQAASIAVLTDSAALRALAEAELLAFNSNFNPANLAAAAAPASLLFVEGFTFPASARTFAQALLVADSGLSVAYALDLSGGTAIGDADTALYGRITGYPGTGAYDYIAAMTSGLSAPDALGIDQGGGVIVTDTGSERIRKVLNY